MGASKCVVESFFTAACVWGNRCEHQSGASLVAVFIAINISTASPTLFYPSSLCARPTAAAVQVFSYLAQNDCPYLGNSVPRARCVAVLSLLKVSEAGLEIMI